MTLMAPLWLIPTLVCVLLAVFLPRSPLNAWLKLMSPGVAGFFGIAGNQAARIQLPFILMALICLALTSPAVFRADEQARRHASGWVLIIDISDSMADTDISPSRLAGAQHVAEQIIKHAGSRSVSLVFYSGDAFLASPFSFDKHHLLTLLQSLRPGMMEVVGSNLYRALKLAITQVEDSDLVHHRVFLLSDAPEVDGRAMAMAQQLATLQTRLDVISFAMQPTQAGIPMLLDQSRSLAGIGQGGHVSTDAFGRIDLETLKLDRETGVNQWLSMPFNTSEWKPVSHWLLLLIMPLVLFIVRGEQ